jgi:rod shape determining protein RodA
MDDLGSAALRASPVALRRRAGRRLHDRASGRHSPLRRLDWVLMAAVLALAVLGGLLVWSATRQRLADAGGDPQNFLKRHLLNLAIGLVLAAAATVLDYRLIRAYAPVVYVGSVVGLAAVLVVGSTVNGARSWIALPGGFELQPSEFAKLGLIVAVAMVLGEKRDRNGVVSTTPSDSEVIVVLALALVPVGLIMLQPDLGMVLVILFFLLGMLAVGAAPRRWLIGLFLGGVLFSAAVLGFHLLKPYQEARLTSFVSTSAATDSTTGYNVAQAKTAIANGGILGRGLFHGQQTQGEFVPEQQTDFVFTVAGEEFGFLGAGGVLLAMGVVLWRALSIARDASDTFGALVGTGVVCWFAFQTFINVGMTLGIMPVTGLPLPFVSYGGSSMFAEMLAIGLLQNVRLRSRTDPYAL